jgi:hypothetical protein
MGMSQILFSGYCARSITALNIRMVSGADENFGLMGCLPDRGQELGWSEEIR